MVTSNRALLVRHASAAGCQFIRLKFVVDSKTKLKAGTAQETVTLVWPGTAASWGAPELQVFNRTETKDEKKPATARSGFPSPLKSPTAKARGFDQPPYPTGAWKVPSAFPNATRTGAGAPSRARAKSTLPSR